MRCPDCNKFVPLDTDGDPEVELEADETRSTVIVMLFVLADTLLLTLPGYCSDWWPVWAQIACLAIGVGSLSVVVSWLAWEVESKEN